MKDNPAKIVNNLHLETQIGKGAMGEVWKARHIHTGATVAIKFLHQHTRQDNWALEAFQSEIRAAAVLTHPNAVMVLDHGIITKNNANNAARLHLQTGSPFLIMELVQGKSLKVFAGKMPWGRVKRIIHQLLSVLAHAHARNVIHRDIKPENVLIKLPDGDSSRPEAMLTDFGLAQALEDFRGDGDIVVGTPAYMAPEQLLGSWRNQGPWTDLYSLACTIWRIIAHEAPFGNAGHYSDLAYAHVHQQPPKLLNTIAIPDGLEGWLLRMLAKRPQDRFYSAAEALHALNALGPPDIEPELNIDGTNSIWELSDTMEFTRDRAAAILTEQNEMPIPLKWKAEEYDQKKLHIMGVGLRMFEIRSLPFFGRNKERDSLWKTLKEVPKTGAQSIIIRGAEGIGKSRLVQWFCEHAQESGVAEVFRIQNKEDESTSVIDMVTHALRCEGLETEEAFERIKKLLAHSPVLSRDAKKIADFISGSDGENIFSEDWERSDLIVRLLLRQRNDPTALAKPRLAIIWNDDAHFGEESLLLCMSILQSAHVAHLPILFVHTIKPEALTPQNPCRVNIAKLQNHPRNQSIGLRNFNSEEQREIIDSMLDLSHNLVDELISFSTGNCSLAKAILSQLIHDEFLMYSDSGFILLDNAELKIPLDIYTTWKSRLQSAMTPFREPEQIALEIAGLIGMNIIHSEWIASLSHFKDDQFRWIEGELTAANLIRRWQNGQGWSFVHPALPKILSDITQEKDRLISAHLAAATGIQTGKSINKYERVGHHLIQSGRIEQGVNALIRGLVFQNNRGNTAQSTHIMKQLESIFYEQKIDLTDQRWGHLWLIKLDHALQSNDGPEIEQLSGMLQGMIRNNERDLIESKLKLLLAQTEENKGNVKGTMLLYQAGEKLSGEGSSLKLQHQLGQVRTLINNGQLDEASQLMKQLAGQFRSKNAFDIGMYMLAKSEFYLQTQKLDNLDVILKKAGAGFSQSQNLIWKAYSIKCYGDACRYNNDIPKAKAYYAKSELFYKQAHHPFRAILKQDLAIIALYESNFDEALGLAQEALSELSSMGWKKWIPRGQLISMCVMAEYEDWGGFEYHYYSMITLIEELEMAHADLAWLSELTARTAHEHNEKERASDLLEFSLNQWKKLGLKTEIKRLYNLAQTLG